MFNHIIALVITTINSALDITEILLVLSMFATTIYAHIHKIENEETHEIYKLPITDEVLDQICSEAGVLSRLITRPWFVMIQYPETMVLLFLLKSII